MYKYNVYAHVLTALILCFSLGWSTDSAPDSSSKVITPDWEPHATSLPCSWTLIECKDSSQTYCIIYTCNIDCV